MRDATGQRYQLGFRVLELQNFSSPEPNFRALCAPAMRQIHEMTGETVSLTVRALDYSVFIDGIETRKPGVWRLQIGALRPLHANSTGHVFLAFADDAAVAAYIARHEHDAAPTPDEAVNAARLWQDIADIRTRGYATSMRAGVVPMAALAFPIWDAEHKLHGVISVGGPRERFEPQIAALGSNEQRKSGRQDDAGRDQTKRGIWRRWPCRTAGAEAASGDRGSADGRRGDLRYRPAHLQERVQSRPARRHGT